MNLKNGLTKPECEYFRMECNFTELERKIFDLRVTDKSLIEISLALHLSASTVSRRLKNIKQKIEKVNQN